MDVEITPEPSEEERQAILAALADEQRGSEPLTPWRQAGLGPGPDDETDDYAATPPRQSRGAART